ncbi:MAG: branched-chain amino acid ABC transporter permease [Candidatus Thermoplasmatota archaeon]|nr:branched-chain amino acid ABC transporter permease [Candidatus Thermoplasmatota archaeon]
MISSLIFSTLLYILLYGTIFGLNYALLTLGFTLVFGVSKILNLSYGALYMSTAYFIYLFAVMLSINLFVSILIAVVLTVAIGLAIFMIMTKFARDPMIFMIAMLLSALLLQYIYTYFFQGEVGLIIPGVVSNVSLNILGVSVSQSYILSASVSLILVLAVWLWIDRSSFGRKVRATSEDYETAELFGINSKMIYLLIFIISTAIVAIAAVLIVPVQVVTPTMWVEPFVVAFAISIIGGLGKLRWTIPAAFIISFSQVTILYLVPYNISDITAFGVVIIFLILLPKGIGGGKHELQV